MKRLYHILALIALINLFSIAGFVGYLFQSGRLSQERVNQIGMVLRGEFPTSQPAAASQPASAPAPPQPSTAEIERARAQREYDSLLTERRQRELDDRRRLSQLVQLEAERKLEELEREKERLAAQRKTKSEQTAADGLSQIVDLMTGLEPPRARDLLKNQKDADAVAILSRMDPARTKKIFNSCKSQDDVAWLGRILNQLRIGETTGAGVDGPKPTSSGG